EGGIRVPFFARGPGIEAGAVCRIPVAGYDFLPTFYDLAGGSEDLGDEIDGASFKSALFRPDKKQIKRPQEALFFHRPGKKESAIRRDDHKLRVVWNTDGTIASRELYKVDPNPIEEGYNIADAHPETADLLQKQLLDYLESVDAETPKPPAPKRKKKKTNPSP
ncbi:MAG: sulfatase, partial [Verrucomicrobiota bacterium]